MLVMLLLGIAVKARSQRNYIRTDVILDSAGSAMMSAAHSYIGNQLKSVSDLADDLTYSGAMDFRDGASGAAEYTYDANGNLTSDRNKGIVSITYNELNLPRKVSFGDGHETLYTYASDGTKLRTEYRLNNLGVLEREPLRVRSAAADVANSAVITDEAVAPYTTLTRRDYCGNYVYCNGRLERVLTPGGYISGGEQHFYITDYQGNVRVVLDSAGRPVEVNSYYPYGALTGAGQSVQPYKYGAKELDRENGLNLYDSQARHYDPILGRTTTLDPKATEYYSISPYAWCAGNPVKYIDPDGRKINMNMLITTDKLTNFNIGQSVINDLITQTGLSLYFDANNYLQYKKDKDGSPIITIEQGPKGEMSLTGSKTARELIVGAIDSKTEIPVSYGNSSCIDNDKIGLNARQINNFIYGAKGVDGKTLGFGMTFLHELLHTSVGLNKKDITDNIGTGPIVDKMNQIRRELNHNGFNYGERANYKGFSTNDGIILPFNKSSLENFMEGKSLNEEDQYIIYKQ